VYSDGYRPTNSYLNAQKSTSQRLVFNDFIILRLNNTFCFNFAIILAYPWFL